VIFSIKQQREQKYTPIRNHLVKMYRSSSKRKKV